MKSNPQAKFRMTTANKARTMPKETVQNEKKKNAPKKTAKRKAKKRAKGKKNDVKICFADWHGAGDFGLMDWIQIVERDLDGAPPEPFWTKSSLERTEDVTVGEATGNEDDIGRRSFSVHSPLRVTSVACDSHIFDGFNACGVIRIGENRMHENDGCRATQPIKTSQRRQDDWKSVRDRAMDVMERCSSYLGCEL